MRPIRTDRRRHVESFEQAEVDDRHSRVFRVVDRRERLVDASSRSASVRHDGPTRRSRALRTQAVRSQLSRASPIRRAESGPPWARVFFSGSQSIGPTSHFFVVSSKERSGAGT